LENTPQTRSNLWKNYGQKFQGLERGVVLTSKAWNAKRRAPGFETRGEWRGPLINRRLISVVRSIWGGRLRC